MLKRCSMICLLLVSTLLTACAREEEAVPETFSFVVYPGARYLGQLTETSKQARRIMAAGEEPPPVAIYDTEAPVEQVAEYYAREYGYDRVAPDATNNMSAVTPPAYYRTGDLGPDARAIEGVLRQMNLPTDLGKAAGAYKAAEIAPRPNRPRVTVQRPYFDVTTSEVVDRTLILMSR